MHKKTILREIEKYGFEEKEGMILKTSVWRNVYTYSILTTTELSKNKAFAQAHSLGIKDEILLAFQNGMSEKDSFIISEDFISVAGSNMFSKNNLSKIYWKDIDAISQINHSLVIELKNKEEQSFEINKIFAKNKDKAGELVKLLQEILKITSDEYKNIPVIGGTIHKRNLSRYWIVGGVVLLFLIGGMLLERLGVIDVSSDNSSQYNTNHFVATEPLENKIIYDTIWSDLPQEGYDTQIRYRKVNVFYEPYQVTIQSEGGWIFDSHKVKKNITIPIKIPENTKHWIYRLVLSNAVIESGETGNLIGEVNSKTKTIYVAGKETTRIHEEESSFLREMIGSINAPSKQKAFVDVYFIDNEDDARKFSEGKDFNYDINNSIKNTHSRNGLVEFNESKNVFLGLDNLGYKDDIYVSLEVVALIENIRYYKVVERNKKIEVKDSLSN